MPNKMMRGKKENGSDRERRNMENLSGVAFIVRAWCSQGGVLCRAGACDRLGVRMEDGTHSSVHMGLRGGFCILARVQHSNVAQTHTV